MSLVDESENVLTRFIKAVNEDAGRHRNVNFFARSLLLTPNYLSSVVKRLTGETVMDWINRRALMEAKIMLRHTDKQVTEIADEMLFPEPSAFVRFFKKHTGITPLKFREHSL